MTTIETDDGIKVELGERDPSNRGKGGCKATADN